MRQQLPALTGLRFFAALLVLCVHFGRWLAMPTPLHTLIGRGGVSVGLFFVLSGFILTHTYCTASGSFRGTPGAFYVARFARIYPVYLCGIGLALMTVNPWAVPVHTPHLLILVLTMSLIQSWFPPLQAIINGPGWSLSVMSQ